MSDANLSDELIVDEIARLKGQISKLEALRSLDMGPVVARAQEVMGLSAAQWLLSYSIPLGGYPINILLDRSASGREAVLQQLDRAEAGVSV